MILRPVRPRHYYTKSCPLRPPPSLLAKPCTGRVRRAEPGRYGTITAAAAVTVRAGGAEVGEGMIRRYGPQQTDWRHIGRNEREGGEGGRSWAEGEGRGCSPTNDNVIDI